MATRYVWDKKTDGELQLWPSSSTERYITAPFLPTGDINTRNRKTIVTAPANLAIDSLARRGISAAAFTGHKGGYYQSRSGAPFHLIIYTLDGSATLRIERRGIKIGGGSIFAAPAGCSYEFSSDSAGWRVFWFHLEPSALIDRALGGEVFVRASKNIRALAKVADEYLKEVYLPRPNLLTMELGADRILKLLRDDIFAGTRLNSSAVDKIISDVRAKPLKNWRAAEISKSLGVSAAKFNKMCLERYSATFFKILLTARMEAALGMMARGARFAEIARKIGYADAYTFSKAFKSHYGKTPKSARASLR